MAKTYNRLEIDVNKKPNSIGIRPVQNDTKSRYLDVCLYENGVAINLTGEQVRITFRKADGSTFFNQGEVTDATAGRCQFALTNEILSEAKEVKAQISVWNASGQILSTQVFEIYISAAIPWTDAVESENEYGVLVVLFQEIQDALDTMHKIATTFGEPGDKAAEYGVDTFWEMLEHLAAGADVRQVLKENINSTMDTEEFATLDELILRSVVPHGVQEFTSSGTFVVPDGVHKILVTACGGGGGGGGVYTSYDPDSNQGTAGSAGGAGAAAIYRKAFSVTPRQSIPITIGSAGAAGASNKKGSTGGTTVVGSLVSLPGGAGGDYTGGTPYEAALPGGAGGGFGGTTLESCRNGADGIMGCGGPPNDGCGGGGSLGNGGRGADAYRKIAGTAGTLGGGGGGGAFYINYSTKKTGAAGKGGPGYCLIEW